MLQQNTKTNKIFKKFFSHKKLILFVCNFILICTASAQIKNTPLLTSDEITIVSDSAELSQKTGIAIHTGHVELTQGSRIIHANKLSIKRLKSGKISEIIANGSPATYYFLPDKSTLPVKGHAKTINFNPAKGVLLLVGNAVLDRKKDTFSGPKLEYHIKDEKVFANAEKSGRTTIVLHPTEAK